MADRLGGVAVVGIPSRGPPVQDRWAIRRRPGQLVPEQAAEQVVIPEPPVLVVQRDQEQVGAVDLADQPGAVGPSGERVAQRRAHAVEDRGRQQEVADLGGLSGQHLLAEVVDDVPACASEPLDEIRTVRPVTQPQSGQLQSGGPALGPRQQPEHVVLGQRRANPVEPAAEELDRLGDAEPQVFGPQLGQVPAYSQAAQWQRRVGPGDEHQVQLRRTAIQQRGDRRVHSGAGDEMVVVQYQDQRSLGGRQFVDERGEHVAQHVGACCVQPPQRGGPRGRARLAWR